LIRSALHALSGINAMRMAAIIFMLSALLFTQSRAAVVALIVGIFALALMLSRGRDLSVGEAAGRRAIVALLVAVLGVSIALSADPLLNRVQEQGINDSTRASLFGSTVAAIQSAPLTGLGFGAYERYYPIFADGTVQGEVDEAHDDILETLADLGVPAGLAYLAGPALLAWMCFAGCSRRRRDRVYPAVGFAASVAVGLHAFADFGLQIPAVAVTYAALLGTGVAQSWRTNMDLVR
ncbi:MAG: O-antigen ligase family protein, partial [Micropepsaceae bacterium]